MTRRAERGSSRALRRPRADASRRRGAALPAHRQLDVRGQLRPVRKSVLEDKAVDVVGWHDADRAREIIAAFEEAEAEGRGVVTVNGRMIENLHVDNARRVLAVADAIAAR